MSRDDPKQSLSDLTAAAVSPVLIMALVGSLVFFLVEVLYVGLYSWNLLWGLFFFVFAAVLIARISIETPGKAGAYGLLLAVPVWLTLQFFVDYKDTPLQDWKWLINLGLIGVIWWSAHRLTWDCTFIDDDADVSGTGLLQAAGLDRPGGAAPEPAASPGEGEKDPAGWWERFRRYREQRRKKHTPGVWVVYFSLAALPLFGLGQSLIPVEEEGRRRYVFWLMVIYVASGLGLLLTTTFLGLRHYLRQRGVKMPAAVTGVWLTMGGGLVLALLALGALLPRPQAEYPLVRLDGVGSPDRKASSFAVVGRGAEGKGRGASGEPGGERRAEGQSGEGGKQDEGRGEQADREGRSGSEGGKDGSGQASGQGRQGDSRGAQGDQGDSRGSGQGREGGNEGQGRSQPGDRRGQTRSQQGQRQEQNGQGQKQGEGQRQSSQGQSGTRPEPSASSPPSFWSLLAVLAPILKWIVYLVFIALVAYVILRGVLQFLANFTTWARELLNALRSIWETLFGWLKPGGATANECDSEDVPAVPLRPFSSYTNPFRDGTAAHLSPQKLVRYTFEAFQAWAYEHHLGRRPDETPLEFAARVGQEVPGLEAAALNLAHLYARALYARGPLPAGTRAAVEQFWQRLEAVVEQPLSA